MACYLLYNFEGLSGSAASLIRLLSKHTWQQSTICGKERRQAVEWQRKRAICSIRIRWTTTRTRAKRATSRQATRTNRRPLRLPISNRWPKRKRQRPPYRHDLPLIAKVRQLNKNQINYFVEQDVNMWQQFFSPPRQRLIKYLF